MSLEELLLAILVYFQYVRKCIFITSSCYFLFLYCFPVATNYFDNCVVDGIPSNHFVTPAFGQQQLSLPQLKDGALHVEPLILEGLLLPTSMVFVAQLLHLLCRF